MLSGQAAIVTGASKGIGRAIAIKLIELGADVGVVQRGDGPGVGERVSIRADLTDPRAAARAINELADELGRLDVLVCNAAGTHREPALDVSLENWERIIQLDLISPFAQAQAAARRYVSQSSGGKIVFLASLMSFQGGLNVSSYAAAKGGIALLTKALANDWASRGIRVNAVAPGFTDTPMTQPIMADEARNAEVIRRTPVGRWGVASEVADAVAFLVSPGAEFIHGHVLPVDGGYLGR